VDSIAFALRPTVHSPKEIVALSKLLEGYDNITTIFIPDIPGSLESIEISTAALSNTTRVLIGSGVIRILEHEDSSLFRRAETIQSISDNRFVLGVGTGISKAKPKDAVRALLGKLQTLSSNFEKSTKSKRPKTYIATLKPGIARMVAGHSDGVILNFCSPEFAKALIGKYKESFGGPAEFACYLKIFYSRKLARAQELMVSEFSMYDRLPNYHTLFVRDMIANDIESSSERLQRGESLSRDSRLFEICLANPSRDDLRNYVSKFRAAGITLPCIYPYFGQLEDFAFRSETIKTVADSM
jgi:alkanesulfonate monooxygenase SsuD/methylene tetrahydromethanopterin reductase-like flavin-dependent oxidoreductase (luciferase family)